MVSSWLPVEDVLEVGILAWFRVPISYSFCDHDLEPLGAYSSGKSSCDTTIWGIWGFRLGGRARTRISRHYSLMIVIYCTGAPKKKYFLAGGGGIDYQVEERA